MKKQTEGVTNGHTLTPVEWLALRYHHRQGYLSQDDIAEAKAMEKHQIMSAYDLGNQNQHDKICISNYVNIDEEQYYNETYNK